MADATARGRFLWHELMTTDTKAASDFYQQVVGWKPKTWDQDPSYTLLETDGRQMAGLMPLPQQARNMGAGPFWMSYIGTPDIEATVKQTVELGGQVHKSITAIPQYGRFAVLQDPQGASFAAFSPTRVPEGDAKPGLGDFSWHELITTDADAAFAFYQKLFGWQKTDAMDMGPGMGVYQMFGRDTQSMGGMFKKPAEMPFPPMWLPYSLIPDSKNAADTIGKAGGKVLNGPMEVPGGDFIVQGLDPQGAMFAVHSRKQ